METPGIEHTGTINGMDKCLHYWANVATCILDIQFRKEIFISQSLQLNRLRKNYSKTLLLNAVLLRRILIASLKKIINTKCMYRYSRGKSNLKFEVSDLFHFVSQRQFILASMINTFSASSSNMHCRVAYYGNQICKWCFHAERNGNKHGYVLSLTSEFHHTKTSAHKIIGLVGLCEESSVIGFLFLQAHG